MPAIDPQLFRKALGLFASGVTVLTARSDADDDLGMTASAFCSVSLDPPLVLVCVGRRAAIHDVILRGDGFAINGLAADQAAVADRFAGGVRDAEGHWQPWPEEQDRFADLGFRRGPYSKAILLNDAMFSLDCALHSTADGGDHTVVIGRVMQIRPPALGRASDPLIYHDSRYGTLDQR